MIKQFQLKRDRYHRPSYVPLPLINSGTCQIQMVAAEVKDPMFGEITPTEEECSATSCII